MLRLTFIRLNIAGHTAATEWQVSSAGRVRPSIGSVGFGSLLGSGYRRATIQRQHYFVHRLVAAAFLGPPPNADAWQVNHIDRNPSNNSVSNLQYVTPAENMIHSWRTNSHRKPAVASKQKPVLWRVCGSESWSMCQSQKEVADKLGMHRSSVSDCCRGVARKARGSDGIWYEIKRPVQESVDPSVHLQSGELWQAAVYPGEVVALAGLMVSSWGRVSFQTRRNNHCTPGTRRSDGYFCVHANGRILRMHRLVAATFMGQPECATMHVNHKDGNRGNNKVENLEYVTPSQNQVHAYANGRVPKSGRGKAVEARAAGLPVGWQRFPSVKDAASHAGVSRYLISKICKGNRAAHLWEFRFVEEANLPGEEWRPVVLDGARVQSSSTHLQASRVGAEEVKINLSQGSPYRLGIPYGKDVVGSRH